MEDDLEFDPAIDKDDLVRECLRQAKMVKKYSRLLANASRARNEQASEVEVKEDELKVVAAEMNLAIREDPTKYKIAAARTTDAAVEAAVRRSPRYAEARAAIYAARRELHARQERVDILYGVMNALSNRRDMIKTLVDLWRNDYFAEDVVGAVPREMADAAESRAIARRGRRE